MGNGYLAMCELHNLTGWWLHDHFITHTHSHTYAHRNALNSFHVNLEKQLPYADTRTCPHYLNHTTTNAIHKNGGDTISYISYNAQSVLLALAALPHHHHHHSSFYEMIIVFLEIYLSAYHDKENMYTPLSCVWLQLFFRITFKPRYVVKILCILLDKSFLIAKSGMTFKLFQMLLGANYASNAIFGFMYMQQCICTVCSVALQLIKIFTFNIICYLYKFGNTLQCLFNLNCMH